MSPINVDPVGDEIRLDSLRIARVLSQQRLVTQLKLIIAQNEGVSPLALDFAVTYDFVTLPKIQK